LRNFRTLIAPFADAYSGEADFVAILDEFRSLCSAYEDAAALLSEECRHETLEICNRVLERRPGNILFRRLEEKAREFEQDAQYEEGESVRVIDPHYLGLDSEVLPCATLDEHSEGVGWAQPLTDETESEVDERYLSFGPPASARFAKPSGLPMGLKIAITEEAWNHFKTGLAATLALLLMVLVLASNSRR
jgi:hypothetical protein